MSSVFSTAPRATQTAELQLQTPQSWKDAVGPALALNASWMEHVPLPYSAVQTGRWKSPIDLVLNRSLNTDTCVSPPLAPNSCDRRLATPQGTFILRNRYNAAELTAAMALLSCPYVCRYHAVVVDGNRDAGFVPVGFIVEDLGDLSLTQWMQRAKADKEKEAKQQGKQPNTGAASISLDAALAGVMRDVLNGVAAVHAAGYAYGGVNASNMKVTACGAAKLTVPSQSSGAAAAEADVRSLAALLQHCIDTLQLDDAAVAAWRPLLDALGAEVAVTPSAALALLPASPTVADAFFSQALMCVAGGMAGLPEDSRAAIKQQEDKRAGVGDVALRCSLTCLNLASFLGKLTAAQRAVSLQWARTTADVIVRFISDGGVGAQLPARAEAKDKALLAAIDALLTLDTIADSFTAESLLKALICRSPADDGQLTARMVRALRQLRRYQDAEALLNYELGSRHPYSAGHAALLNEQIAYLGTSSTKHELGKCVHAIDDGAVPSAWRYAVLSNKAKALVAIGDRERLMDAVTLLEETQRMARDAFGPNSVAAALELVRKADAIRKHEGPVDHAATATRMYEQAFNSLREAVDLTHPSIPIVMINSAKALLRTGEQDRVIKQIDEAIRLLRAVHGDHHPVVLQAALDKAEVLQQSNSLKLLRLSVKHYDRVLAAVRASWSGEDLTIANASRGKALLLEKMGDRESLGEALSCFNDAAAVYRKTFQRSLLMEVLCEQARCALKVGGQGAQAIKLYDEAIVLCRKQHGKQSPRVASMLSDKADALQVVGGEDNMRAAIAIYEEVLAIKEATIGIDHPSTASTYGNQASALQMLGDRESLERAVKIYTDVIAVHRNRLGDFHSVVAISRENKATALRRLGDPDSLRESIKICDEIIATHRAGMGEDHPAILSATSHKANALQRLGGTENLMMSVALSDQVIQRMRAQHRHLHKTDAQPHELAPIMTNKATALRKLGDRKSLGAADRLYDELIVLHEKAATLAANTYSLTPALASALKGKAAVLTELGDRKSVSQAVRLYDRLLTKSSADVFNDAARVELTEARAAAVALLNGGSAP